MSIIEELENYNSYNTLKPLTVELIEDALNYIRTRQSETSTKEMTVVKIACNKKMLEELREAGCDEAYLKIAVLNYDQLVK